MKRYRAGIVGATGMVGQRFVSILYNHPWFEPAVLAASFRSKGKTYEEAVSGRWYMPLDIPENVRDMAVWDAEGDCERIADAVDFIFCAVDMKKEDIRALEERYARYECPVVSNNGAHRWTPDVPMVIPEINPEHLGIIPFQRRRFQTKRGFIAVKSNCSIQSYVPLLHPLKDYGLKAAAVCTYQAISGAGKTFDTWPEMLDNVIPYIGGEEEKSEQEPLKIWGHIAGGQIVRAESPLITAQCVRVPVTDGHLAAVFASFERKVSIEEIISRWREYQSSIDKLSLPSSPSPLIYYFDEPDRPQTARDRDLENGMAISAGRLRADSQYDVKFVGLSHNTKRGAAGGAVLLAELLCAEGYI